ncbi:PTS sugar transporter subunit IIA [Sporolactobacillus nakayamae]|uniref:Phosphotransferase system mannitol/fructose-specific IIA domain (Ntr-type) n=1 Tax=Sporolactobacillus nakayamae TaxID=269670 RepID=A0A1I2UHH7_9BACL|nr:PTS sugar transporter subunit IIA [Sporolactobacillus nakayamae]SFG75097.1 Phosphotransferase system mannitol/fructose-specific IIA domain (Ntr-type) [Sporolactobacillus nakayamae]
MAQFIERSNIRLQQTADNWEDAIRQSGLLLLQNHSIDFEYINEMVKAVKTLGPYMVIVPHVALGHARPGKHVKKNDISLLTLKKPINFGSEHNDPVNVVFSFCAEGNEGHLQVLKKLGLLLDDAHIMQIIQESSDLDQIDRLVNEEMDK